MFAVDAMARDFQEAVEERAQRELSQSLSASSNGASYSADSTFSNTTVYSSDGRFSAGNGRQPIVAAPPDLQVSKQAQLLSRLHFLDPAFSGCQFATAMCGCKLGSLSR